jgi:SAM-dependent methyltransferase
VDIRAHNSKAWDREVERGNEWTVPVTPERISAARQGTWEIRLTPGKPVPREWYPPLEGARVLCLASGGGQQGPILAAAGADVTVYDNSPSQLARDREVAKREDLKIETIEGDMADLKAFPEGAFDLIVHPVSNCFAENVRPVWKEAFRVLKSGGALFAAFVNPAGYLFDSFHLGKTGDLRVANVLPYSDFKDLHPKIRRDYEEAFLPFEFGHTLTDQIGGQIDAGFFLKSFYEDRYSEEKDRLSHFMDVFIATRGVKP